MNKKSYWFYLEPYVYISLKKNKLLLYNTLSGKILEYGDASDMVKTIKRLKSRKNLLIIKLSEEYINGKKEILKFIKKAREYFIGDLIDTSYSLGKPFQIMPILNIQKDISKIKIDPSCSVGEGLMKYLKEISIYINNQCHLACPICKNGYLQFLCCFKGNKRYIELDVIKIRNLLEQTKGSHLNKINILGGNLFEYSSLKELTNILFSYPIKKIFYINYMNIFNNNDKLDILKSSFSSLQVLVTSPIIEKELRRTLKIVNNANIDYQLTFVIQKKDEIEKLKSLISDLKINNFTFQPYFNEKNLSFFRKYVFIKKNQLLRLKLSFKEIFSRTAINLLNFGKLIILNNGDIYANVNARKIGNLGKDTIFDAVYSEMDKGTSWRRVRTKVKPCRSCVFDVLCPPISNYEFALKMNNLCHI